MQLWSLVRQYILKKSIFYDVLLECETTVQNHIPPLHNGNVLHALHVVENPKMNEYPLCRFHATLIICSLIVAIEGL